MKQHSTQHVFTLVEMLTVIGVIVVLAGMTLGVVGYINTKAAMNKTEANIKKLEIALEMYKKSTGYYVQSTGTDTGFKITPTDTELIKCIDYQAMYPNDIDHTTNKVLDGWGGTIYYRCPGSKNTSTFDLGSMGSDGEYGNKAGKTDTTKLGLGDDICNFKR